MDGTGGPPITSTLPLGTRFEMYAADFVPTVQPKPRSSKTDDVTLGVEP